MVAAMPATVPDTGETTWLRNWFPSSMGISGSNGEEMIDPSFCVIIELSDFVAKTTVVDERRWGRRLKYHASDQR